MTETVAIAIRFGLYVDLMLLFGLPMFGLYALRGTERRSGEVIAFRGLLASLALLGLGSSVLALLVLAASMSGVPLGAVDRGAVDALVSGTSIGTAWQVRMAALLLTLYLAIAGWKRPVVALIGSAAAAGVALASLAWTGHGAMDEGTRGFIHLTSDILHLLAAGVWIGALVSLVLLIFRPATRMVAEHIILSHRALDEFATIGSLIVGVIVVSGLVNSWVLVGPANLGGLFTTLYGQLLLIKLVLFLAMLAFAAVNRFRLTPALEATLENGGHAAAVSALRRSLVLEATAALAILGLVAWLGTLSPPASGM